MAIFIIETSGAFHRAQDHSIWIWDAQDAVLGSKREKTWHVVNSVDVAA